MKNAAIPDKYIPNASTAYMLRRLSLPSILEILRLWQTLPLTKTLKQEELEKFLLRCEANMPRKSYATDKVIHLYPKGLNLLHISILETQLIFESKVTWRRSDLDKFVNINTLNDLPELLSEELSQVYINHVYSTRIHDGFFLIRVQLFEIENINKLKSQSSIFFIIPQNTNYIIHNSSDIFEIELILQLLSKLLSTLIKPTSETVKSLQTILTLNSKHREELGVWNIYNQEGQIDISPFDDPSKHESLIDRTMRLTYQEKLKELSWLRFKSGQRPTNNGELGPEEYYSNDTSFQSKNYRITNTFTDNTTKKTTTNLKLTLKLKGNDVFAGLHEMTDLGLLQIEKLPSWMTGEDGFTGDEVQEIDEFNLDEGKMKGIKEGNFPSGSLI